MLNVETAIAGSPQGIFVRSSVSGQPFRDPCRKRTFAWRPCKGIWTVYAGHAIIKRALSQAAVPYRDKMAHRCRFGRDFTMFSKHDQIKGYDDATAGGDECRGRAAGTPHRADRLGKLHQPTGDGSAGQRPDQQVRRRLSGQALLRRLRARRMWSNNWPSTAPRQLFGADYANVQPHSGSSGQRRRVPGAAASRATPCSA